MTFDELGLIYGDDYKVNDYITIHHPTVEQIKNFGEQKYFQVVMTLLATPIDYKVELYDLGKNYSDVDDFEFFCANVVNLSKDDTCILFGDFDFKELKVYQRSDSDRPFLFNEKTKSILDDYAYKTILEYLCKMHNFEKKHGKPATEEFLKYTVGIERSKQKRNKNKPFKSLISPYIITLVNCQEFKYDYSSVLKLPIYALNESARSIQSGKFYSGLIFGIYSGNVSYDKISKDELNLIKQ